MASALEAQPNWKSSSGTPPTAPCSIDPGDGAVPALLEQDARHIGRDAEAEIDRPAGRAAPAPTRRAITFCHVRSRAGAKTSQRPEDLAGDGRVVGGLRRLHLVRGDDDMIDQDRRAHARACGLQRAGLREALHLGDDDAAVVAGGQRLVERAEIGALMLVGEIAALVGGGGADDRDLAARWPGRRATPRPSNAILRTMRRAGRGVHGAALAGGIDEGVEADLGQHARPLRRGLAMHVEQDAGGHVVGGDAVLGDHPPDLRRLGGGRAARGRSPRSCGEAGPAGRGGRCP